ncbi:IclR family transcriptional regulator [Nocardioides piscis]|uniref:Glycerol operon regulatory protein n=1 Tax=Nocardioides piscis TaxID=2714938 RepID=A0A6G7YGZ1_9ACTN|nr:helix-turn-helix domain-containing protein [Nocardioides piscis]QIK75999.1 helix-turn-helix domain-containing protein [Nocardioides piscis]
MSESRAEPPEVRGTLGTVRNAVRLLDLLADGPAYQQLTDLAERSGLSVPTAHRLLRSLVLADLVEQNPRSSRYSLGPEVTRLSQRYLGRLPILGALSPYLVSLRDTLQTTIHVAVLVRESVVYVDRIDAGDGGPYRDSHRVTDALSTSAGRILAARSGDDLWRQCLAAHAPGLDGDPDEMRATWAAAPFLADPHDELAVVVHDATEGPVAALAATVPQGAGTERLDEVAKHLTRAAAAAGRTLGHA